MSGNDRDLRLHALRQLCADYEAVTTEESNSWPVLSLVAVRTTIDDTQKADETCFGHILAALEAEGREGWARFRSAVDWTGSGRAIVFDEAGPPLMAEWTIGARASKRLRTAPDAPGEVRIWKYEERDLGQTDVLDAKEDAFLCQAVEVMARDNCKPADRLVYHVYWAAPEAANPHAIARVFDRFAGFVKMGS